MPNFNFPVSDGQAVPEELIARAATANPTNSTDGQMVAAMADKAGRLVVTETHTRELCKSLQTAVAGTGETTIVTAGGAGVFNDLTGLIITTANAAVGTLTIKDGTGGTTKIILNYPNAASAPSSPMIIDFTPPISQNSANANWTITASANASGYNVTAQYIQNT
jgi:hypothetical protein